MYELWKLTPGADGGGASLAPQATTRSAIQLLLALLAGGKLRTAEDVTQRIEEAQAQAARQAKAFVDESNRAEA